MRYFFVFLVFGILLGAGLLYIARNYYLNNFVSPLGQADKIFEKPLLKYQIGRLRDYKFKSSKIILGKVLKDEEKFESRIFYFQDTFEDKNYKVSGLINIPKLQDQPGKAPIILMARGFVPQEIYTIGEGTRRTAEEFARSGYVTLAPDFLGYGESDMPSEISLEERFQTYTTFLSLLSSLGTLDNAFIENEISISSDNQKIGIWGHSNGGQIALTVLAVNGLEIPTVLWAPVTKPFPYNILYFTDEYDDEGKALRKVVADFEKDYDVFSYSFTRYLDDINASLQIHQGGLDEAVPIKWSEQFVKILDEKKIKNEYFEYPGENHNFNNGSWPAAVSRSIKFFAENGLR